MCMRARKQSKFTLKQLEVQFLDIKQFYQENNRIVKSSVCKKIKYYAELIIWGDKNDPDFFDHFCENQIFEMLYNIFVQNKDKQIKIVILQSIAMLLINISKQDSLNYLLSHPSLILLQQLRFEMMCSENKNISTELAQYYINFLKTVANKLDAKIAHLFYNEKYCNFSLLWQTMRFYNHPESLVRTTSRNIILSMFRLKNPLINMYLSNFPFIVYYPNLISTFKNSWVQIDNINFNDQQSFYKFKSMVDDNYDTLLYIEDLIKESSHQARFIIINSIINNLVVGLIRNLNKPNFISRKLILYIILMFLQNSNCEQILEVIILLLLGGQIHKPLFKKVQEIEKYKHMKSFNAKWDFKSFWDVHEQKLMALAKKRFNKNPNKLMQFSFSKNQQPTECQSMSQSQTLSLNSSKYSNISSKAKNFFGLEENPFEIQIEKIQKICGINIKNYGSEKNTILTCMDQFKKEISLGGIIDFTEYCQNQNKAIFYSLLESKDGGQVLICLQILISLYKLKTNPQILLFCGVYTKQRVSNCNNQVNLQQICLRVLKILNNREFSIMVYIKAVETIEIILSSLPRIDEQICKSFVQIYKALIKQNLQFANRNLESVAVFQQASFKLKKIRVRSLLYYHFRPFNINQQDQEIKQDQLTRQYSRYFLTVSLMLKLKTLYHKHIKINGNAVQKSNATPKYSIGSTIEMQSIKGYQIQYKQIDHKKRKNCVLIENVDTFVIVEKQQNTAKVILNLKYSQFSLSIDNSTTKKLLLTVGAQNKNIQLTFLDAKIAIFIMNQYENYKQKEKIERHHQIIREMQIYLQSLN